MQSPDYEERICAMFDSFAKTVSRNFVRNLQRAEINWNKHYSDEPVDEFLALLGHRDAYPSDAFFLYADGKPCVVESDILYEALLCLPEKQQMVILLDFWCEITDEKIAERLEVTPRTVYNLRQRAYSKIREHFEKRGRDP